MHVSVGVSVSVCVCVCVSVVVVLGKTSGCRGEKKMGTKIERKDCGGIWKSDFNGTL